MSETEVRAIHGVIYPVGYGDGVRYMARKIGTKWVYTSPDVPELHISHENRDVAFNDLYPTLVKLREMQDKINEHKKEQT